MAIVAKRTIMSLHSDREDVESHKVRIVLAMKGVNVEIIPAKQGSATDELLQINPYGTVPTLIDRELILYEARIIMEYLDERFPHPPLLPVYPVARAETRKMMHRIEKDWYTLLQNIMNNEDANIAREALLDCAIAPLLWRLPQLGIEIPAEAKALHDYMQRIFKLEGFQISLTDAEKQLRAA